MNAAGLFFSAESLRRLLANNSESFMELGLLMRKGIPMAEALHRVSRSARSHRLKNAANLASIRLNSGESSDKVFAASDMAVFPPAVRYILAAPMQDQIRGMLIADLQQRPAGDFNFEATLFYPVMSMGVGMLTLLSLYMFVLPQMREIFLGLRIKSSPFIAMVFDLCGEGSLLFIIFFVSIFAGFLYLAFVLARRMTDFSRKRDEMNLLRMLAAVPAERRLTVTDLMAVKHNFPSQHANFRQLARGIADGMDVAAASRAAGISDGLAWFFALAVHDCGTESRLLMQAYEYYHASIKNSNEKTVTMIEVTSTLLLSTTFGAFAYALVEMMNAICIGTIQ
ncbi:MAG: hypothetical protein GQF41_0359 [Candidatus Rifleibacterium amylolyticum]|nr:MAG: hypothetical protein GQF41_0359 [Candidatus Rifleibacterium amylolyticum]